MKKQHTIRGLVFLLTLVALVFAAIVPQTNVLAQDADLVRLTINNKSERDIWYRLDAKEFGRYDYYYFHIPAGEARYYTPVRGVYEYILYACGINVKGDLDLSTHKVINVPECGMKSHYGPQDQENIEDVGDQLRLVDVTLVNDSGRYMKLILEGPSVFVFQLFAEEEKEYTIPMGYYEITMYGCGGTHHLTFYARFHKVKEFTCP
ncbi:MAG: hypothetical protein H8E28_11110 [Anaerolineae bacterium]|nr:hypothetical protein [Anaerolineae bacterium]